ncbi:MAG: hypothetical protein SGI71_02745 [Verrucomicrobiota bacterium]|nr:hypothetical protein [Verrucomicrobiota bacterium]
MSPANVLRFFYMLLMGVGGWFCAAAFDSWAEWSLGPILGLCVGMVIGLMVILVDRLLKGFSLRAFSSATFGLILGCVMAALIMNSGLLEYVEQKRTVWLIRLVCYMSFGYLGMMLALRSNKDDFSLIIPYVRFTRQDSPEQNMLLDTSVIIDGRIADLVKTGFITGTIFVPRFILSELQSVADSSDATKRARGRRGLDILKMIQSDKNFEVKIIDNDPVEEATIDGKLVRLARLLSARIFTNDYNLNKVAEIQKVHVLNINDLVNALKTAVLVGDDVSLRLIKEGREAGQAIGYLTDGTMIVVNHGGARIGQEVNVRVVSVLQTSAGRLVFGEIHGNLPALGNLNG